MYRCLREESDKNLQIQTFNRLIEIICNPPSDSLFYLNVNVLRPKKNFSEKFCLRKKFNFVVLIIFIQFSRESVYIYINAASINQLHFLKAKSDSCLAKNKQNYRELVNSICTIICWTIVSSVIYASFNTQKIHLEKWLWKNF